ncbi:MAG: four helix bundle protein [Clostridia bacterium]|nr:four helix bundle protein [Clostridia bacterium]
MNVIYEKSFHFAIRVVKLYRFMTDSKKEFVLSKQLLRSGTSIGANIAEAEKAQSSADFYAKMNIALKEANETRYWLRLLHATDYLTDQQFFSVETDTKEIIALLTAICKKNPIQ